jgi:hypothetical protein
MIDQIGKLNTLKESQENVISEESDPGEIIYHDKGSKKKDKNMMMSLSLPRVKFSILEASDFEKELVRGLKEKIGVYRND